MPPMAPLRHLKSPTPPPRTSPSIASACTLDPTLTQASRARTQRLKPTASSWNWPHPPTPKGTAQFKTSYKPVLSSPVARKGNLSISFLAARFEQSSRHCLRHLEREPFQSSDPGSVDSHDDRLFITGCTSDDDDCVRSRGCAGGCGSIRLG